MKLNAILVCVDYSDLLSISLPYNRHHFDRVMVVTTHTDTKTIEIATEQKCWVWTTDAFYRDGAIFNKWRSLEEGLDAFGREGWMVIADADILWPKTVELFDAPGTLCTPRRRMLLDTRHLQEHGVPPEEIWYKFPLHPQEHEFAGYTQVFHSSDPVLGRPPWHEIDYTSAGTADSWFQMKWPASLKIRPSWEVLHIGAAGQNWCGRVTPYLDGTVAPEAATRQKKLLDLRMGRVGKSGMDRFKHEKLG